MKKTAFKIILDVVMTIMFLATMAYSLTGGYLHELIGLVVLGLFVVHNILNIKWITAVTKKVFKGTTDGLSGVKYVIDLLLLILFIAAGGSGILISDSFFTNISTDNRALWVYIHNVCSYSALVVLSVHIGLHWQFIMAAFRKMFHYENECTVRKVVLRVCAFALAVLGIKANIDKDFTEHFVYETDNGTTEQKQLAESVSLQDYTAETVSDITATENVYTSLSLELTRGHGTASYDFSSNPPSDAESLDEYLGRLNCTGCGRRCLFTNPQCNTGMTLAVEGTEFYNSYSSYSGETEDNTDDSSSVTTAPQEDSEIPSLDEYLGKLHCTGCGKSCLLSNPQCGTGVSQAENAEIEYNNLYSNDNDESGEESESTDKSSQKQEESSADTSEEDKMSDSTVSEDSVSDGEIPSLDEYLGKLTCNGCGRHCLLTSPQCNKGVAQAEEATSEYNQLYKTSTAETQELIFEDDELESLKSIFTTMIPVMALYVAGTHYIVKFTRKKGRKK